MSEYAFLKKSPCTIANNHSLNTDLQWLHGQMEFNPTSAKTHLIFRDRLRVEQMADIFLFNEVSQQMIWIGITMLAWKHF